jgi:hypothetical protein
MAIKNVDLTFAERERERETEKGGGGEEEEKGNFQVFAQRPRSL